MCTLVQTAFAQQSIEGKVTDEIGLGVPGATIQEVGTNNAALTDFDGNYVLSVENNEATLLVSFLGYVSQEILVSSATNFDVQLVVDTEQLDVVVLTGYTAQSKVTVTGAMSQINTEEALSVPIQNAGEALQGRASGVYVVTDGQPGSTPLIRIRGFGTTNANGPLLVIDGMQTTDASVLSQINPNDIESMNVLKDASAAIYGARASNGVIIVTTKSGSRDQKPRVSFSSYVGFQKVGKTQDVLNSQQLGDVLWQSFANDGIAPVHPQYGSGATPVIPQFVRGTDTMPYDEVSNKITRAQDPGTNWVDEIFQTAPVQNYDLSIQGGSMSSRYLMSVGYQKTDGIQLNTGFERFSTRLNAEFDATDNIRFGEHLSVALTDLLSQNQIGNATRMHPLVPIYDEAGIFAGAGPSTAAGLSNVTNPVAELIRGEDNFDKGLRVIGDVYTEISFLDDFTVKSSLGFNINDHFINDISRANPEAPEPKGNSLTETNYRDTSWIWSNTIRWDKKIGEHDFHLLAGVEAVSENYRITQIRVQDFLLEDRDFFTLGAGTGTPSLTDSRWEKSTLFSYLFNANYSFKGKYLATVSVRRDKTSRFAEGNNTGVFPSASVGWILSKEKFMESFDPVSFLKVRVSYGILGNQDIPVPNPYVDILELQQEVGFYPISGISIANGAILSSVGNPDLKWEKSKQFNIGFDARMLDDSFSFSLDYFNNTTEDMIIASPLPTTAIDANAPYINAGEVNNTGFDFSLSYNNDNKSSEFKWDVGLNISAYKNELVQVNGNNPESFLNGDTFRSGTITRSSKGLPISYYFGREVLGIFQNASEVSSAPDQGFATPEDGVGRFRYRDIDGNGTINDDDRKNIGNPHPDFTYGLNANFSYKKFFLTLFVQGVQGNELYNFAKVESDFPTFFNSNRSVRVLNSWSESNTGASLPALSTSIFNNETQPNSYFIEDGSYLRLKNFQIGYNFEVPSIGIESARIYFQATNLLTITSYDGDDPEIGNNGGDLTIGVDQGRYPLAKSYMLGWNFNF